MPSSYHSPSSRVKTRWDAHRLGWLCLASFPNFGARSHARIRDAFPDGATGATASLEELCRAGIKPSMAEAFISFRHQCNPTDLALRCDAEDIQMTLYEDPAYPSILKEIHDPPAVLFHRGDLPTDPGISLVGTRRITSYGEQATRYFSESLCHLPYPMISGLAQGVDATMHRTAIEGGRPSIAVLPGGVDDASLQPRSHLILAHKILETGGCLLSELPPGTEALRHFFPLRNRIISGLSRATIVIEAAIKSGSLITARLALEQNRDVFVVPGSIFSEVSAGCHLLLRDGAHLLTHIDDLRAVLDPDTVPAIAQDAVPSTIDRSGLTPLQCTILDLLSERRHADDLARELALPAPALSTELLALEIAGIVVKEPGNFIRLH